MLHPHLKEGLRLNRTIGFAFLIYTGMLAFMLTQPETLKPVSIWPGVRLIAMAVLTLGFLALNEISLKALKRHPRIDELSLEKLGLLLPLASFGFVSVSYLLSGQLGVFLFVTVSLLQALMFGHRSTARIMTVIAFMLYAVTMPLGYPLFLAFSPESTHVPPTGFRILLSLLPFFWVMAHFGSIVGMLVRTSLTRVSRLQSLAATDALTGLINRRQFNLQLDAEIARARRYRGPLSLALFDIDDFKKINDFYGHPTGDRILRELGEVIRQNTRESDISARYGGEEFALILPETSQIDAYDLLERLRAIVERTVFCLPDNPMTITISVGVAQLDAERAAKSYELIEMADVALYEAKKQGKNRVIYGLVPTPKINYPPFGPG